jgi:galactose mutarotase-like enzyme
MSVDYTIKSAAAKATISSLGAELQSLCDADQQERLWQGDPTVWSGRAPVLFPIVGSLKNDQFRHQQHDYTLHRHGFARKSEFTCSAQSNDSITLQLLADDSTLAVYPWRFELQVQFTLQGNTLRVQYSVTNADTTPMPFTIGSHPAFALPHPVAEYAVHFSAAETLQRFPLTADGLLMPGIDYLQQSQVVQLSDTLFDDDALVFKDIQSRAISLYHKGQPLLTVDTGGAPHLGIWAKPAASFVCIEPWFGYSDDVDGGGSLQDKPSMMLLDAGQSFTNAWHIELH